jgi:hypothetical protein
MNQMKMPWEWRVGSWVAATEVRAIRVAYRDVTTAIWSWGHPGLLFLMHSLLLTPAVVRVDAQISKWLLGAGANPGHLRPS